VVDDPTAKRPDLSRPHKPHLDEMGIALYHEVKPARSDSKASPRKPTLDEMGPGVESKPYRPGPRSSTGKPGMRGGWRPRRR
jgi:excinuclease ABC subunit B